MSLRSVVTLPIDFFRAMRTLTAQRKALLEAFDEHSKTAHRVHRVADDISRANEQKRREEAWKKRYRRWGNAD